MSVSPLSAPELLQRWQGVDAIIDARSEAEYALDHLPGALNWPTLNNAERHEIGTLYAKMGAFEARKLGAAYAAANIASHLQAYMADKPKGWKPLIYCWRGGQRSGSLALVLGQIGFSVQQLQGGYKAFRAAMLLDMARLSTQFEWRVLCGPTGVGKTRLLQSLRQAGEQVLDLEALANHRSSVLGLVPGSTQPSQKHFDTLVWNALRQLDPARPVYVESESKRIGQVSISDELMQAMRNAPCLSLQMPLPERVRLLQQDYDFFVKDTAHFCARLDALIDLRGHATVKHWQDLARKGQTAQAVEEILAMHYDPLYYASIAKNFKYFKDCPILNLSHSAAPLEASSAQEVIQAHWQLPASAMTTA
jgi:tRNA 2-selenouridine synthase